MSMIEINGATLHNAEHGTGQETVVHRSTRLLAELGYTRDEELIMARFVTGIGRGKNSQ